jgi:phosphinothricin acetyltransferase
MTQPTIRLATTEDMPAVNDLYNHYVLHSTCTYQEAPEPIAGRHEWFARHGAIHPVVVAEIGGCIVGWGALSPYHSRCAYRHTVENSVYVDPGSQHRGIGSMILGDLIDRARALEHHAILAVIDADQVASIGLHRKFGFEEVGRFREVGRKFGRWLDVVTMELRPGSTAGDDAADPA